jgi:pentapeptide MXKDX repeat protein
MMKQLLFVATISAGLAYAPAAMAQATPMEKPMKEKMMDKKPMAKPASDKMKKDGMMDKKDSMPSDKMKR